MALARVATSIATAHLVARITRRGLRQALTYALAGIEMAILVHPAVTALRARRWRRAIVASRIAVAARVGAALARGRTEPASAADLIHLADVVTADERTALPRERRTAEDAHEAHHQPSHEPSQLVETLRGDPRAHVSE